MKLDTAAPLTTTAPARPEAATIWMDGVVKPVAQNLIGGVGVAVVAGLLGGMVTDDALLVGKIAGIAGAVVFGAACAVRAFRDEIGILVAAYTAGQRDETVAALRAENGRLVAEIERLKSEGMVAHAWGAREAAERLAQDYYRIAATGGNLDTCLSREQAMLRGYSRAEWEQGVGFLRHAGVLAKGNRGGIWTSVSEEAALAAIARHAATARVSVRAANGDMSKL
jgi:hypothetical protein